MPMAPDQAKKSASRLEWSTRDLLEHQFPEPKWKVDGLLPEEGFGIIAGKRKIGKGWLTMQIAHACATGQPFLDRATTPSRVLLYALEDNPRRIHRRMTKQGFTATPDIVWCFTWPGFDAIKSRMLKDSFDFCFIDTLSRALPGVRQNDVDEVTRVLSGWQEFAMAHHVIISATDHERKSSSNGVNDHGGMDEVLGTQAKTAVADFVIQLHRKQGSHRTLLSADGRDYEQEVELVVDFNRETTLWELVGDAEMAKEGESSKKVCKAMLKLHGENKPATTTRLAERTGLSLAYVSGILANLLQQGKVIKEPKQGREQPYLLVITLEDLGEDAEGVI
jgi:predicted transcriptional regulator